MVILCEQAQLLLGYPLRVQGLDYKAFHTLISINTPQVLGDPPVNWSRPFFLHHKEKQKKAVWLARLHLD